MNLNEFDTRSLLFNAFRDILDTYVTGFSALNIFELLNKLVSHQVVFPITMCRVKSKLSDLIQDFPVAFVCDTEVVCDVLELVLLLIT